MKKIMLTSALLCLCATLTFADDIPVAVDAIPQPVAAKIQEYFPGARIISADQDWDDGRLVYETRIQYKEIGLEVELTSEGRIVDVEMKW